MAWGETLAKEEVLRGMSTPNERFRNRILARARQQTPELGREIVRAWDQLSRDLNTAQMAQLIASGQGVVDDVLLDTIFAEVERLYVTQSIDNMAWAAKDFGIAFGTLDPGVIQSIRTLNLKMADSLKDDVREVVRAFVEDGLRDGLNPRTIARRTRNVVGLTEPQLRYIARFENGELVGGLRFELENNSRAALRRQLGRGLIRRPDGTLIFNPAHAGGIGVSKRDMKLLNATLGTDDKLAAAQVDRIVGQYGKRLTAWHAESIARTATLDSLKNATHQATERAINQGILPTDRMMSEWVTAGDDRVRDEHVAMAGTIVRFGQRFPNGEVVPGENTFACRCVKRDFLARTPGPVITELFQPFPLPPNILTS